VDLCAVLDVVPRACRPYRAKTKGKVERLVREVKQSFLGWLGGQLLPTAPPLADDDQLALQWRNELVLPRRQRTTGQVIAAAWERERPLLRPVPDRLLQAPTVPAAFAPVRGDQPTARRAGEHVQIRDLAEYEVAL
jgi:hypothetical protein